MFSRWLPDECECFGMDCCPNIPNTMLDGVVQSMFTQQHNCSVGYWEVRGLAIRDNIDNPLLITHHTDQTETSLFP